MTFTYASNLSQPLDYLRFRLDDKEEEYANYSDEELQFFIDKISGTPTELDLDKVALKLIRQQLQEILRGPSRERAGSYEIYQQTAGGLRLAIEQLEDDIRRASPASPSFGGVYKADVKSTRNNDALVPHTFYKGRVYRHPIKDDEFFKKT